MNTHADKTQGNKSHSVANTVSQKQNNSESTFQFVDNRPEAIAQRKLQSIATEWSLKNNGSLTNVVQAKWIEGDEKDIWKWDKLQDGLQWFLKGDKYWYISLRGDKSDEKTWDEWKNEFIVTMGIDSNSLKDFNTFISIVDDNQSSSLLGYKNEKFAEGSTATIHHGMSLNGEGNLEKVAVKAPIEGAGQSLKDEAEIYEKHKGLFNELKPYMVELKGVSETGEDKRTLAYQKMEGTIFDYWAKMRGAIDQEPHPNSKKSLMRFHAMNVKALKQKLKQAIGILEKHGVIHDDLHDENILWSGNILNPDFRISDFGRLKKPKDRMPAKPDADHFLSAASLSAAIFGTSVKVSEDAFLKELVYPAKRTLKQGKNHEEVVQSLAKAIKEWPINSKYERSGERLNPDFFQVLNDDSFVKELAIDLLKN